MWRLAKKRIRRQPLAISAAWLSHGGENGFSVKRRQRRQRSHPAAKMSQWPCWRARAVGFENAMKNVKKKKKYSAAAAPASPKMAKAS
jgi:hypothetical protein